MPSVLIVSRKGDWTGLLRLPGLLHRAGARVDVFSRRGAPIRSSRHVAERFDGPVDDTFADALRDHLAVHRYDWVILGDEPTMYHLADAARRDPAGGGWISRWFPMAGGIDALTTIASKTGFMQLAEQFSVPVPEFENCQNVDVVAGAAERIGYPVVVKASLGSAGDGVLKVGTAEDLPAALARLGHRLPLLVQKFEGGALGVTDVLYDHGRPVCWWPMLKRAVFPDPYGPSTVRVLLDQAGMDEMKPIVEAVGRMSGFHGFCSIDWITAPAGGFRVIEFNPRPIPGMHLGRYSGQDVVAALRQMIAGEPATPQQPRQTAATGQQLYFFPQYAKRALRIGKLRELSVYLHAGPWRDVPWDEPLLVARHGWALTKFAVRRFRRGQVAPARPASPIQLQVAKPVSV